MHSPVTYCMVLVSYMSGKVFSWTASSPRHAAPCSAEPKRDLCRGSHQPRGEIVNDPEDRHALVVGDRAHRIVGLLVSGGAPPERASRTIALARTAQSIFQEYPVTYRPREALFQAVTAAGVYLSRFHPRTQDWSLLGVELVSGSSRFDLVYESRHGVLIDELKLGQGRSGESLVRTQIDKYVQRGAEMWGDHFLGVRMCSVHEPARARFFPPKSRRSALLSECGSLVLPEIR